MDKNFAKRIAHLSPKQRALLLRKQAQAMAAELKSDAIPPRSGDGPWPASMDQAAIWFFYKLFPTNCAFNIPSASRIRGIIDHVAMEKALKALIQRHEILRTRFVEIDGRPFQDILEDLPNPLHFIDLTALPAPIRLEYCRDVLVSKIVNIPFVMETGPMFRLALIRMAPDDHVLVYVAQHALTDWWSFKVVARELYSFYEGFARGETRTLPHMPIQFADYSEWRNAWLKGDECHRQRDYWVKKLKGAPTWLDIPGDRPRPAHPSHAGSREFFMIPSHVFRGIREISRQYNATSLMTLMASVFVFFSRYTGAKDILFGSAVTNREKKETERLLGYLLNILIFRGNLTEDPTFAEFLGQMRTTVLEAFNHIDYPFHALVEELNPVRDLSRMPLYQVEFIYVTNQGPNLEDDSKEGFPGEEGFHIVRGASAIDLQVAFMEDPKKIELWIEYQTDLFDKETIQTMGRLMVATLEGVLNHPEVPVSQAPWMGPSEHRRLLERRNLTLKPLPEQRRVHGRIAAMARSMPQKTALVYENLSLTYAELERQANRLANALLEKGVKAETPVGLCLERGPQMVIGLLAIMKSGGFYIPLDPHHPADRLQYIAADAGVGLMLCDNSTVDLWQGAAPETLQDLWSNLDEYSDQDPEIEVAPESPAYAIYTSGSTGRPKGVAVPHHAVVNFMAAMAEKPGLSCEDRLLAVTTISFDIAGLEIYLPLMTGATVCLASTATTGDAAALARQLEEAEISVMQATPSTWQMLFAGGWSGKANLRAFCGGEALPPDLAEKLTAATAELWNLYGPTETTIWSASSQVLAGERVHLGEPIDNTLLYVVDSYQQIQPDGVPGELLIGGDGLARGYLGRPALTAEKFVPNPFMLEGKPGSYPGSRLYRTGDLVRHRPSDGRLLFLGRLDHQVKLRGYRIELGEIEVALTRHPEIRAAVALVVPAGADQRLAAWIVAESIAPEPAELRSFLEKELPPYMIPAAFVVLDSFPLTPNKKVDRRALPAPKWGMEKATGYVAPRTPLEIQMAVIWKNLLAVEQVGIYDNFFDLGGHSLLATALISRVRDALQIEIPLPALFENPVLMDLVERIEPRRGQLDQEEEIPAAPRDQALPVSYFQKQLWLLEQLEGPNAAYNLSMPLRFRGKLNQEALQQALNELVARNEILRTTFGTSLPEQIVAEPGPVPITRIDFSHETQKEDRLLTRLREMANTPMNLATGPLHQVVLFHLGPDDHLLFVNLHHIISDGWSIGLYLSEFSALYDGFAQGKTAELESPGLQYGDFCYWHQTWLENSVFPKQIPWWQKQLAGAPLLLNMPMMKPNVQNPGNHGDMVCRILPHSLFHEIKRTAAENNATLYMLGLAAWKLLIHRFSGQDDFLLGTPSANRMRRVFERTMGFFVNNLVLRSRYLGNQSFSEFFAASRKQVLETFSYQDVPYPKLVDVLNPERHGMRNPLVQATFGHLNPPAELYNLHQLELSFLELPQENIMLEMVTEIREVEEGLLTSIKFKTDLFTRESMALLLDCYCHLLEVVTREPATRISQLSLLDQKQRQQILQVFNDTTRLYPQNRAIPELFREQCLSRPLAPAIVWGDQVLNYGELERKSNCLANYLVQLGARERVGVILPRSTDLFICLPAILKAGCAYVPLDPDYPEDRLAYMLEDTRLETLITTSDLLSQLIMAGLTVSNMVLIDEEWDRIQQESDQMPVLELQADSPAYIIYTSGSSGTPKGVIVNHRNITRLIYDSRYLQVAPGDGMAQVSNPSFDAMTFEVWSAFLYGARLCIVNQDDYLEPERFAACILKHQLHHIFITAALFDQFAAARPQMFASMKTLLFGGDRVAAASVRAVLQHGAPRRLVNGYGPTESTTFSNWFEVRSLDAEAVNIPIGMAIANTTNYVVDQNLELVAPFMMGELLLGGDGLSSGYLNQPALTAEKFIPNPFSEDGIAGSRLYRTGDRVWRQADGPIVMEGRFDHQVKIRGYRIELGEIEAVLRKHQQVSEVAVLVRDVQGDKQLVAWYVGTVPPRDLQRFALKQLPAYMTPSFFEPIVKMPTTPNGKLDREALPNPTSLAQSQFVAPKTPLEKELARLWAELLGLEQVGLNDNFFALGGHSLLAVQLLTRVRKNFNANVPMRDLFSEPSLKALAAMVEDHTTKIKTNERPQLIAVPRTGQLPLSYNQMQLWLFDQLEGTDAYNNSFMFRYQGPLDIPVLKEALSDIVSRHENLRTTFVAPDGLPFQQISAQAEFEYKVKEFNAGDEDNARNWLIAEAGRHFDLAVGPLVRFWVCPLGQEGGFLQLGVHHIISDGWSLGIFFRELSTCYKARLKGEQARLAPMPIQYADFAVWQQNLLASSGETHLAWWVEQLADVPAVLQLPSGKHKVVQGLGRAHTFHFELDQVLTRGINNLAVNGNTSLFVVLMAAWQTLLSRYSGQDDLVVGTPSAWRDQAELEPLIGYLVNMLVIRTRCKPQLSFSQLVGNVHNTTMDAFAHQDLPVDRIIEALKVNRNSGHHPLFQVTFTLQNMDLELPDLPGVSLTGEPVIDTAAKFDISLSVQELENQLYCSIDFNTDLFEQGDIQRMASHLGVILEAAVRDPDQKLAHLPLLTKEETEQILHFFNPAPNPYPQDLTIGKLIHQMSMKMQHLPAIVSKERVLSYAELERRSNVLANFLINRGASDRVGLLMSPSPEYFVALVAILKAGYAYVPLDPDYPLDRLAFMIKDTGLRTLITTSDLKSLVQGLGQAVEPVFPDEDQPSIDRASDQLPSQDFPLDQPAYILYTSGSTGTPKGVLISQRNILRLMYDRAYIQIEPGDGIAQVSHPSFDAMTFEVWSAFIYGARLCLISKDDFLEPERLDECIQTFKLDHMLVTSALFEQFVAARPQMFAPMKTLFFGGDRVAVASIRRLLAEGRPQHLINLYGPTECAVNTNWYEVNSLEEDAVNIPIGMPIHNSSNYVVDSNLELVPAFVDGELLLGGDCLSSGYLNQPALTALKFIPNPFARPDQAGSRLYRSGDRVRQQPNGQITIEGRFDFQVKIRGFRIEPGEIEALLRKHPQLSEVAVLVRNVHGDKQLVAWYVGQVAAADLQAFAREQLPDYMTPAYFMALDRMPVTANGKLDREALPNPNVAARTRLVPPRNRFERELAALWTELLGLDEIGLDDNFFVLGGHSILAVQLLTRVYQKFNARVSMKELFREPIFKAFALKVESQIGQDAHSDRPKLVPVERTGDLPLSYNQFQLWLSDRMNPSDAYNTSFLFSFEGQPDLQLLEQALADVVVRHENLRTTFVAIDDMPYQKISDLARYEFNRADFGDGEEQQARSWLNSESCRHFNLAEGPLVRFWVARLGTNRGFLQLGVHHIISDGWSLGIFFRELSTFYRCRLEGVAPNLQPLEIQYADFAYWQQELLAQTGGEVVDWWLNQLTGAPPVLTLPGGKRRPQQGQARAGSHFFELDPGLTTRLHDLANQQNTSMFVILMAAWQTYLSRYSGQADMVVGTPSAWRDQVALEPLIGYLINVLAIRSYCDPHISFRKMIERVHDASMDAFAHQDLPLDRIFDALKLDRNSGHHPLFQVTFTLQNMPLEGPELPGLKLASEHGASTAAKFDLVLVAQELDSILHFGLDYNSGLFDEAEIARMVGHFKVMLEAISRNPDLQLGRLPLLTRAETEQQLVSFNPEAAEYPKDRGIGQLVQERARLMPDRIAISSRQAVLSFDQLERKSNRLAHFLLNRGARDRVGVMMSSSPEMFVVLTAILKAGCAYVPLDPDYPEDRLAFMFEDTDLQTLITTSDLMQMLVLSGLTVADMIFIDEEWEALDRESDQAPLVDICIDQPAYVIYTSGSTGMPKGVVVSHRNIIRLVYDQTYIQVEPGDGIAQVSNSSFDAMTFEVWTAFIHGARLCLVEKEEFLDPQQFEACIVRDKIHHAFITSALFDQFAAARPQMFAPMKTVLFGGDRVVPASVRRVLDSGRPQRLLNGYGPTESTTFSNWFEIKDLDADAINIPIGMTIHNTTHYVVDQNLGLVPLLVEGELLLGGDGLSSGYLNRPSLTAEKFVPNPYANQANPGSRLYRTGDRVWRQADGAVVVEGRFDLQVKVRGFRIELGEIEAVLCDFPAVKEAAVLVRQVQGDKQLVAWFVGEIEAEQLRDYLSKRLPAYMTPQFFVPVTRMPVTANGKLDRESLPDPSEKENRSFKAPKTALEKELATIWRTMLGLEMVGLDDNFFNLGGNSLSAIQLLTRIRQSFKVDIPMRDLFSQPTLEAIALLIEDAASSSEVKDADAPVPVPRTGDLPLSHNQLQLWLTEKIAASGAYNSSLLFGYKGNLDRDILEKALTDVVLRHENLRTTFVTKGDQPVQRIGQQARFEFSYLDMGPETRDLVLEQLTREAMRPFDLEKGPLLRVVIHRGEGEGFLLLSIHHIISDGWSLGVFFNELSHCYIQRQSGKSPALVPMPIQYADFAVWQRQQIKKIGEDQLSWWKEELAHAPPLLVLPSARRRPGKPQQGGSIRHFTLGQQATLKLRELALSQKSSLFVTLMAAWQSFLARYSGQNDILVGTPSAYRDRAELEPLIGYLINMLVIRTRFSAGLSFRQLISQVHKTTMDVFAHQDLPFDFITEALRPDRDSGYHPVFQVSFVLQNMALEVPNLPGAELESIPFETGSSKMDLILAAGEDGDQISFGLEFNTDLFDEGDMDRMLVHFKNLLEDIARNPDRKLDELELAGPGEIQALVHDWNQTAAPFPLGCLYPIVAEQARQRLDQIAIEGDYQISWREFLHKAGRVAASLQEQNIYGAVGVSMTRSPDLFIAILGVLQAGCWYVPIDPENPDERVEHMLKEADVRFLVTDHARKASVPVLEMEKLGPASSQQWRQHSPDQPAYTMFTSGSTGLPKGVAVSHRNILNLVSNKKHLDLKPDNRIAQTFNLSFDPINLEIWSAFVSGARLCIVSKETLLNAIEFADWMTATQVDTVIVPTAVFNRLAADRPEVFKALDYVGFGGERASVAAVQAVRMQKPKRILNLYGPTECSVLTLFHEITEIKPGSGNIPIGRPMANTTAYVVDSQMSPTPVGVPGELFLGGEDLAIGYWGRSALTAAAFVPNSFSDQPGARLYKTGDLVRHVPDGQGTAIEFFGRRDHQVKLRGIRIELGEVVSVLESHPQVETAFVMVYQGGETPMLAAWLAGQPDLAQLKNYISQYLPVYMVPASITVLDELPLTANGKVDVALLPKPERVSGQEQVLPRDAEEEAIALIWSEILGLAAIGVYDNFFDLGGHSLSATRVITHIRTRFGVNLGLREFFTNATVAAQAELVRNGKQENEAIPTGNRPALLPLSFAQQRLWLAEQMAPGKAPYNIPLTMKLLGAWDQSLLQQSINQIVARHETLRTSFPTRDGQPFQQVSESVNLPLEIISLEGLDEASVARRVTQEAGKAFNLEMGPLVRVVLFRLEAETHILLINMHHIISDGWSLGIFFSELSELLEASLENRNPELAALKVQYGDFSVWQREYLSGKRLDQMVQFWTEHLAGAAPILELPITPARPAQMDTLGWVFDFNIPQDLATGLKAMPREYDTTLFMVLLTLFQSLLARYAGVNDVVVGTPIANRNREETEGLIGFFVNTLPLRAQINPQSSFGDLLKNSTETVMEAWQYQDLPFNTIVDRLEILRDNRFSPVFQHMFILQNLPMSEVSLAGLNLEPYSIDRGISNFDLTLAMAEDGERLLGSLEYNDALFTRDLVKKVADDFVRLAQSVWQNPNTPLEQLWQNIDISPNPSFEPLALEQDADDKRDKMSTRRSQLAEKRAGLSDAKRARLAERLKKGTTK